MSLLPALTGSFSTPAAGNPTGAMVEAAYAHHGIDARYLNVDVTPEDLSDAVRGAKATGWIGFNSSLPHKVAVIEELDELAESARLIGAVNCAVRTDGRGMLLNQAAINIRLWTGVDPDRAVMGAALDQAISGWAHP